MKQLNDLEYVLGCLKSVSLAIETALVLNEQNIALDLSYIVQDYADKALATVDELESSRRMVDVIAASQHVREMEAQLAALKAEA